MGCYQPFVDLCNLLIERASGRLSGVPHDSSYPISRLTFLINAFSSPKGGQTTVNRPARLRPDVILTRDLPEAEVLRRLQEEQIEEQKKKEEKKRQEGGGREQKEAKATKQAGTKKTKTKTKKVSGAKKTKTSDAKKPKKGCMFRRAWCDVLQYWELKMRRNLLDELLEERAKAISPHLPETVDVRCKLFLVLQCPLICPLYCPGSRRGH